MGSAMITVHGKLQIEGKVIHIVSERIEDSTPLLRQVGEMDFPHHTGRGDGATHGGSPDRGALIRVKTRDFH
jgi:error-prone DNA polymerase